MTLIYYDPVCLQHETGEHPESAGRIIPASKRLLKWVDEVGAERPAWQPATREQLLLVHPTEYIEQVREFCESGGGHLDADTVAVPESFRAATTTAGAVCDAVTRVSKGEAATAFCLVRPPGHHALPKRAMGFCLFNSVAVGCRTATKLLGVDRILVVDWDVHHGNGTQAIFWEDPSVGFFSIHRWPFYPGTGDRDETGQGRGLGTTRNIPVAFGTPRTKYLQQFRNELESFAAQLKPQLVIISAGFDSHRRDPIGSLGLESEDFATLTQIVRDIANTYAGGKIVSVLEGGYDATAVAESVMIHLDELNATDS